MGVDISQIMDNALNVMDEGSFQQAAKKLSERKDQAREKMQAKTAKLITDIIRKLADNKPLDTREIDLIKIWIVGDAESYVKMENNFNDWLDEYKRLRSFFKSYGSKECSVEEFLKIHGALEDAIRVSYDIANFIEKRDRIKRFEGAVADGIDREERDILVKVLTSKLKSDEY